MISLLLLPLRAFRPADAMSTDPGRRGEEFRSLAAVAARQLLLARLRRLLPGAARASGQERAVEAVATHTVQQLGAMKGLSMKVGQMLSYLSVLPDHVEDQLAGLQANATPLTTEVMLAQLDASLGVPHSQVFSSFDLVAIAAASVGQVHRARLLDDRPVAVKVQYPGVAEAFHADLVNLNSLLDGASRHTGRDVSAYSAMISSSVLDELDYRREQRNQQRLHDTYSDHPYVLIPATVPSLCRPRVLVSEYVEGLRFHDALRSADQSRRNELGEIMYRFAFGCVMNDFFSGDPHPGNYLFLADGRVCFLDFGLVLDLSKAGSGDALRGLLIAAVSKDDLRVAECLQRLGLVVPGGPSAEAVWSELQGLVLGPIDGDGDVEFSRERFRASARVLTDPASDVKRATSRSQSLQPWTSIWLRYAAGTLATISRLSPSANWHGILSEVVLGTPAATEVGANWGCAPGGAEFHAVTAVSGRGC